MTEEQMSMMKKLIKKHGIGATDEFDMDCWNNRLMNI